MSEKPRENRESKELKVNKVTHKDRETSKQWD